MTRTLMKPGEHLFSAFLAICFLKGHKSIRHHNSHFCPTQQAPRKCECAKYYNRAHQSLFLPSVWSSTRQRTLLIHTFFNLASSSQLTPAILPVSVVYFNKAKADLSLSFFLLFTLEIWVGHSCNFPINFVLELVFFSPTGEKYNFRK